MTTTTRRRRGSLISSRWCWWVLIPSLAATATATVEAFVMVPTTTTTMARSIHRPATHTARIRTDFVHRELFIPFASSSLSSSSANDEDATPTTEEEDVVVDDDERFSVAPMMGHTTRHYRYFWRLFSRHATLYTEMIPSSSIVQAYQVEAERLLQLFSKEGTKPTTIHNPDCIQEVLERLHEERLRHPERPMSTLEQLLRDDTSDGKIVLQLGGRDPHTLATAAAIGTAYRRSSAATHYSNTAANYAYSGGINLNCGCPSASVAEGRRTGAALMLEPHHVVECLNAMTDAMHSIRIRSSSTLQSSPPPLSVKHRLGVQDAHTYQQRKQQLLQTGQYSSHQEANEAYQSCHDFVSHLLSSSHSSHNLSRIQVHARLALLGLDTTRSSSSSFDDDNDGSSSQTPQPSPKLWVGDDDDNNDDDDTSTTSKNKSSSRHSGGGIKINHQRVQYRAKQHARQATIDNRRIPPLHPNVVSEIAKEFSSSPLQIVTNGGMQTLDDVQRRMQPADIHGAMVGRGAINHPCAFANVDRLLVFGRTEKDDGRCQTRRQVLEGYIAYCIEQEEEYFQRRPTNFSQRQTEISDLCAFRKELVAPVFHLLVGEDGNAAYQRLLKRLVSRAQRHTAAQILQAAVAQVPDESLNKPLREHVPWTDIQDEFQERHGEAAIDATKRSGSMQRIVF